MTNIEIKLTECIKDVGKKMTGYKYLQQLLKNQQKFEGWFQIELARCLIVMWFFLMTTRANCFASNC